MGDSVTKEAPPDLARGPTLAGPAVAATLSPEQAAQLAPSPGDESAVQVQIAAQALPARIGRYLILRRLGEGGMGVVYSAYDPELDRKVALKLLRPSQDGSQGQARMRREAQAMAQVSHSHIVQVYEVAQDERLGQMFVAMEFVAGQSLSVWQERRRRQHPSLSLEEVREYLRLYVQAGRGLQAAHRAGLIHRDFKPDNVLVGDDGRVRVADFGLARSLAAPPIDAAAAPAAASASIAASSASAPASASTSSSSSSSSSSSASASASASSSASASVLALALASGSSASLANTPRLTLAGSILGTPGYMSPEQVRGQEADARSDQFSFCAALHEALYGQLPFVGDTYEDFVLAILENRRRPRSARASDREIPLVVARAIERGLSVDPAARFPSMAELLVCLEHGLVSDSETGSSRRNSILAIGLIGIVVSLGIAFAWIIEAPSANESMGPLVWITVATNLPVAVIGWLIRARYRVHRRFRLFFFMIAISSAYMLVSRVASYYAGIPRSQHLPSELLGMSAMGFMACYFVSRRLLYISLPISLFVLVIHLKPSTLMPLTAIIYPWVSFGTFYIALTKKRSDIPEAPADAP